jgi:hypothetical protein
MSKKPQIAQPREVKTADSFVGVGPETENVPSEPTKRITVEVGQSLHYRIKRSCLDRQINMADAIREVLEHASWPTREAA